MVKSVLILLLLLLSSRLEAQVISIYYSGPKDTLVVGDTGIIGQVSYYSQTDCYITKISFGGTSDTDLFVESQMGRNAIPDGDVVFTCRAAGVKKEGFGWNFEFGGMSHCQMVNGSAGVTISAVGVSDSIVMVRPKFFTITMRPSKDSTYYQATCEPQFWNNIADTTIFDEFRAEATNHSSCTLQVFDSINPISQFVAHPFTKRHPLQLQLSTKNYRSFDSLRVFARIHHNGIDSLVTCMIKVFWPAYPLSVEEFKYDRSYNILQNPFYDRTSILLWNPIRERTSLSIFDVTGRIVRTIERECNAGQNEIEIDGSTLPPGAYWYVVRAGEWAQSGKLMKIEP